jgi:hypothetical protein
VDEGLLGADWGGFGGVWGGFGAVWRGLARFGGVWVALAQIVVRAAWIFLGSLWVARNSQGPRCVALGGAVLLTIHSINNIEQRYIITLH